jgi:hypothetical protein
LNDSTEWKCQDVLNAEEEDGGENLIPLKRETLIIAAEICPDLYHFV